MNDEIQKIINTNFPAQVGEALKKRLEQAGAMEKQVASLQTTKVEYERKIDGLTAHIRELTAREEKAHEIIKREQALEKAEQQQRINEAVLKVRQDMTDQMLGRDLEIVKAVFANNRYKYAENRTDGHAFPVAPTAQNPYPCPQTTTTTGSRNIESEG